MTKVQFFGELSAMVAHVNQLGKDDGDPWAEIKINRNEDSGKVRVEMRSCTVDALSNADLVLEQSGDNWLVLEADASKYGFNHRCSNFRLPFGEYAEKSEWIVDSVKFWYHAWCDAYEVPLSDRVNDGREYSHLES